MNLKQRISFPLFFCLLVICLQTVSAQDKQIELVPFDAPKSSELKIEKNTDKSLSLPPSIEVGELNDTTVKDNQSPALEMNYRSEFKNVKYQFHPFESEKPRFDFGGLKSFGDEKRFDANTAWSKPDVDKEPLYVRETAQGRGFNYTGAFKQSFLFLGVQHGYAIAGQAKTRRALKHGPFFRDYVDSVKSLHGWDDGGRFFTNYIAHPMQGALTGHIYVQNSPQALREEFSMTRRYFGTRLKAMLWTTAWSTQFEIGPISQASIGNVGLKGKQTWEDIVVTPTAGTTMLIAEDALDRYAVKYIERRTSNRYIKIFARMLLNPTRNFSNLLRFREPWYRDRPAEQ